MVTAATQRVREHRARLRQEGLRPVQLWVPDTRRDEFRAEAERESRLANEALDHDDVMAWLDYLSEDLFESA